MFHSAFLPALHETTEALAEYLNGKQAAGLFWLLLPQRDAFLPALPENTEVSAEDRRRPCNTLRSQNVLLCRLHSI